MILGGARVGRRPSEGAPLAEGNSSAELRRRAGIALAPERSTAGAGPRRRQPRCASPVVALLATQPLDGRGVDLLHCFARPAPKPPAGLTFPDARPGDCAAAVMSERPGSRRTDPASSPDAVRIANAWKPHEDELKCPS